MGVDPSAKLLRPSRLPKRRQQVAAVCYRIRRRGIEFLLVQTRGGRWIFPKGGVESGLTNAQSAALEAFEEAGVHGRMEEIPFARYFHRKLATTTKDTRPTAARSAQPALAVAAHLCEVSRLEPPQESNRNPTWFSAEKAKQRLLEDRAPEFGAELARVVDRAAARIRRLHGGSGPGLGYTKPVHTRKEALQEVLFEAFELAHVHGLVWSACYPRYIRREHPDLRSSAGRSVQAEIPVDARLHKRPTLRLGSGTASSRDTLQKVQFIDEICPTSRAKAPAKSAKNRRE
ncbi:MAG TPA: NUDIX domain-containing protein [Terriglobales bacterium]|nr:NUDIX domain-containing protein [Terriglobales bacterium]